MPTAAASSHEATAAMAGQERSQWRLMWCHKDSYQKTEERRVLIQTVRSWGVTILCFKNASSLLQGLGREAGNGPSVPYLLLIDPVAAEWILNNPQQLLRPPVAALVLCEDACSAQRACARLWFQGFIISWDRVSAHQDVGSVVEKLTNMPAWLSAALGRIGTAEPTPTAPSSQPHGLSCVALCAKKAAADILAQESGSSNAPKQQS